MIETYDTLSIYLKLKLIIDSFVNLFLQKDSHLKPETYCVVAS